MDSPYDKIIEFLKSHDVRYELLDHEPVYTSAEAARVRGVSAHTGAKALVLKANGEFLLAVIPGDHKLDSKKMKILLGVKEFRFATSEEVKNIMECEIGACYPFGEIAGLEMIVDNGLKDNGKISFNPGRHEKTITMAWQDYARITHPQMADVSKV